jgi:hypothetical protein
MAGTTQEIIGVFRDEAAARAAADAAARATGSQPRVGGAGDDVASLEAEMREDVQHTFLGPGNVATIVGAVLALPLAFIPLGSIGIGARLLIAALIGAAGGATVGFMVGGFAAKGPAIPLAAERGTTVIIDVRTPVEIERVTEAMRAHDPIRIDLATADGNPVSTSTTEEEEHRS